MIQQQTFVSGEVFTDKVKYSTVYTVFTAVKATLQGLFMHVDLSCCTTKITQRFTKCYKRVCYIQISTNLKISHKK